MYISEIKIENFRIFGSDEKALILPLKPGLTAIVGENDSGKTAIIDALRLVLGTRDQEYVRVDATDFHCSSSDGKRATQISIRCTFRSLTEHDRGAFAEYLSYETLNGATEILLHVTWIAKWKESAGIARRYVPSEWRTGIDGNGPPLDAGARFLLAATYLRPLRDAERALSAGRGSRISQILQYTKEIKDNGTAFQPNEIEQLDPKTLSVLGIGDYANFLLEKSKGIESTRKKLDDDYLAPLSFTDDSLGSRIGVSRSSDDKIRLRQLLEKLEVSLSVAGLDDEPYCRGLGSNNLLFMACELLLLATESEGFPLLLVEEPEAHLHPQRQLRLIDFLQKQVSTKRADGQAIQIILTTHSPNLASDIPLDNLVLIRDGKAFPMARGSTKLNADDYRFLERFLDVTKANLFFSRGVVIVEGDAENILLPTIARLLERDFRNHGISLVNVGGVGLRRYANIFLRTNPEKDGEISIPVACITDMDVMPDCAPWIVGILKDGEEVPKLPKQGGASKRKWRRKSDFDAAGLAEKRSNIQARASGQQVATFVANEWTFEYDLAYFGLEEEVWTAALLAEEDENINKGSISLSDAKAMAVAEFAELNARAYDKEKFCSHIYARFTTAGASKAIASQYLSDILDEKFKEKVLTPEQLRKRLPNYIVEAIAHVSKALPETVQPAASEGADTGGTENA